MFFKNILLGFTLSAPIGPVNLECIKSGMREGFHSAFLIGLGAIFADLTYMLLIYFGLGGVLQQKVFQQLILVGGTAFLAGLGLQSIYQGWKGPLKKSLPASDGSYLWRGYFLAISSPLTLIWWIGVFGSVLSSEMRGQQLPSLLSCLGITLGCFLWVIFLAAVLQLSRNHITDKILRIVSVTAGLGLIWFAGEFIFSLKNIIL